MLRTLLYLCVTAMTTSALGDDQLIRAIEQNDRDAVARIATNKDAVSRTDEQYGTPLIFAVKLHRSEIVKQLVAAGAPVDQTVMNHGCALSEAVRQSDSNIARLLLDLGADPNVRFRRFTRRTSRSSVERIGPSPVEEACRKGKPGMLSILLKSGGDPEIGKNLTAFHWTVHAPVASESEKKNLRDVIRLLLKSGCDPNQGYQFGGSPLVAAITRRRTTALRILLEECKTLDTNKKTMNLLPLVRVIRQQQATTTAPDARNDQNLKTSIELVRLLLEHGAKVTPEILEEVKTPKIQELLQESLRIQAEQVKIEEEKLATESVSRLMKLVKADRKLASLFPVPTDFSSGIIATYNERCANCHGPQGRGANSKSRVFRFSAGLLSWKSTKINVQPTRTDLAKVIRNGLPRNKMPAFPDLSESQTLVLADFVVYLAIINDTSRILQFYPENTAETELPNVASRWKESDDPKNLCRAVSGTSTPESISRGEILFNGDRALCFKCHGRSGEGDGEINSMMQRGAKGRGVVATPGLRDNHDRHLVVPGIRNLKLNQSSRQEVYNRIETGIPNVKMPGMLGRLKRQQISDLTDFVLSIADTDKDSSPKGTPK